MNNLKNNILIGLLALVLCLVITITNGINFFYLIIPLVLIVLILFLSGLLKKRFGKTYGIAGILFLVFIIPVVWYLISANMPMTYKMMEHQKKSEDLSAFQKYSGGVDAKKEVADYQLKQDSILKEQVSLLLSEGKVDSALALIKQNEVSSQKIKDELFSSVTSSQINKENSKDENNTVNNNAMALERHNCGNYPEGSERYLNSDDIKGKSKQSLRVMRNEIYMRHGYIFSSPDLIQYAYKFDCYKPQFSDVSNFLSPVEKTNIQFLKKYEDGSSSNMNGQPALINDPDGYTNIRSGQGTTYDIVGIVKEGEEFYVQTSSNNEWWKVTTKNGIAGYMHKSRIRLQ